MVGKVGFFDLGPGGRGWDGWAGMSGWDACCVNLRRCAWMGGGVVAVLGDD